MKIKFGLQFCLRLVVCGVSLATLLPMSAEAQTVSWKRQLGTSSGDGSASVATDSNGNVYTSGYTDGELAGTNNSGIDAWVAKYNVSGTLLWKRQLGLFGPTVYSNSVATDSLGNAYIAGFTDGSFAGTSQGSRDGWVAKYDDSGALVWKQQLGTSRFDQCNGVATDSNGNVYISGVTEGSLGGANQGGNDAWVAKYSTSGTLVWKRQLGSSDGDDSDSVATDSNGNVYITGDTYGDLTGSNPAQGAFSDPWVAKYNSSGTLLWKRQIIFQGIDDFSNGIATDRNDNVYISGATEGSFAGPNSNGTDAWVAKYNSSGTLLWKEQLGLNGPDVFSNDVETDSLGNVYISGSTNGALTQPSQANLGSRDAWVAKYNPSGTLLWKEQVGTSSDESSSDVATDSNSNVYVSGETMGSLGGANQGLADAWLVKYTQ